MGRYRKNEHFDKLGVKQKKGKQNTTKKKITVLMVNILLANAAVILNKY